MYPSSLRVDSCEYGSTLRSDLGIVDDRVYFLGDGRIEIEEVGLFLVHGIEESGLGLAQGVDLLLCLLA